MPDGHARTALVALGAAGAVGASAAIWGIGIERYLFTVREHEARILPTGSSSGARAAPLGCAHGALAEPQAGAGWRRWPTPGVLIWSSTPATTSATPRPARTALRVRSAARHPRVFVHGSNDHAAPTPRNPLRYFTGPSTVKVASEPLDAQALDGYLADELGWLDLNNACRLARGGRHQDRRLRRQRRAPRLGRSRRASGAAG